MLEQDFNSIEDIDRALDEEFAEPETEEETQVEEEVEEPQTEEETQPEQEEEEPQNEEVEVEDEQPQPKHYTKEEKQQYAFAKMRKENSDLAKANKESQDFLETLAKASGYADVASMKQAVAQNIRAKEAEKQGISPEVYDKINQQQKEIEQLKAKEIKATQDAQVSRFQSALDSVVNEYGFGQNDIKEMFDSLENDGYTFETLISQPNPSLIIKGAFGDKIFLARNQKALAQEKKATLDTTRLETSTKVPTKTIDDEIAEEMREYAKENGYYYER